MHNQSEELQATWEEDSMCALPDDFFFIFLITIIILGHWALMSTQFKTGDGQTTGGAAKSVRRFYVMVGKQEYVTVAAKIRDKLRF